MRQLGLQVQDPAPAENGIARADTSGANAAAAKVGKDPTVETDFLPDRERERREQDMRDQLKQEYLLRQQVCCGRSHGKIAM